jgi:hypothetical protein
MGQRRASTEGSAGAEASWQLGAGAWSPMTVANRDLVAKQHVLSHCRC